MPEALEAIMPERADETPVKSEEDGLVMCINQLYRSHCGLKDFLRAERVGDCSVCTPHSDNRYCSGYRGVKMGTFYVQPSAKILSFNEKQRKKARYSNSAQ